MKTSSMLFKQIQKAREAMAKWPKEWLLGLRIKPLPEHEDCGVNFDLERMKESLEGPFITLPHGMKREELRAWLHEQARREGRP